MNGIEGTLGLVVVIFFAIMIIVFSIKPVRIKFPPVFRKIPAVFKLRRALGLAVEDGTRVHVTLGSADVLDPSNTSAFVGLSALHRVGQLTSTSDLPPVCTSGNGNWLLLSQDTLHKTSVETNTRELYDPGLAQMTGVSRFSYAVGTLEAMQESGIKTNVFIGNFGSEAGLLCDATEGKQTFTIAASDSITSQSIFYALSEETMLGEELYALPAYLGYQSAHVASLRAQDTFRVIVELLLVAGSILTMLGIL